MILWERSINIIIFFFIPLWIILQIPLEYNFRFSYNIFSMFVTEISKENFEINWTIFTMFLHCSAEENIVPCSTQCINKNIVTEFKIECQYWKILKCYFDFGWTHCSFAEQCKNMVKIILLISLFFRCFCSNKKHCNWT